MSRIILGGWEHDLHPLLPWGHRVIVITDTSIARRYRRLINQYEHIVIGTGEKIKTLATIEQLHRELIERGADRQTFLLGIGGGIVTDITGFVASTFMRGVRFGFVSTTLLGQVDASVGGKNGVNLDGYKNMIGCFNQPEFVLCDIGMLRTLSDRQFRAGLAELIKTGLLGNRVLFEMVEALTFDEVRRDPLLTADLVLMAIKIKAGIVERDERESGERRKLNLGHTVAHAIEKCSRKMLHGEAVAVGLHHITRSSLAQKLISKSDAERIFALIERYGFDTSLPVERKELLKAIEGDKKRKGDSLHIIFPTAIGAVEDRVVPYKELDKIF